jgi:hypothetical protein
VSLEKRVSIVFFDFFAVSFYFEVEVDESFKTDDRGVNDFDKLFYVNFFVIDFVGLFDL